MERYDNIVLPDEAPAIPTITSEGIPSPAGFTIDLLPCRACTVATMNVGVLVHSNYRGARFLHPLRAKPNAWERKVRIVEYGTISLQDSRLGQYAWEAEVRESQAPLGLKMLKKVLMPRYVRIMRDTNGEFELGGLA